MIILLTVIIYQQGGRSLTATYFSQALYVTRIGVINSRGWLLTLSPQHDNHYEEIKERSTSEDQRRHSYHSNSGSSVQSSKSAAHLRHEGHYSYNCYEEVPAVVGQYRPSHPIHSLTQSDIEKALATSPLDTSRVVCYCFAICLAITFLIAIVMIISNIITNMYLTF